MKKWLLIMGAGWLMLAGCKSKTPEVKCTYGNDVPEAQRNVIEDAGARVIEQMEKQDYNPIYQEASPMLQQVQTRDQFSVVLRASDDNFGPKHSSQVEELYLITSKARENQVVVPCNLGAKGVQDFHIVPANAEVAALVGTLGTLVLRMLISPRLQERGLYLMCLLQDNALSQLRKDQALPCFDER